MNKLETNKGITLIALIITIIVMLILVGVSVNIALGNGLFKKTQEASKDTELAKEYEYELSQGQVTIGNTTYNSLNDYINISGAGKMTNADKRWTIVYDGEIYTYYVNSNASYYQLANTYPDFGVDSHGGATWLGTIPFCVNVGDYFLPNDGGQMRADKKLNDPCDTLKEHNIFTGGPNSINYIEFYVMPGGTATNEISGFWICYKVTGGTEVQVQVSNI